MNLGEFYTEQNRTSGFMDPDYGGPHWGQDLNSASRLPAGTQIPALSSGRVVRNRWQDAHGWYMAHEADEPGWYWTYSHRQSQGGPAEGQSVTKNGSVGPLGNTGVSTAAHVHVQYTQFPDPWQHTTSGTIDPWPKIQSSLASWAGGGFTPIPNGDDDMRLIQVPGGTIALVGEFFTLPYTSTKQAFSYETNGQVFGSVQVTADQATTLINEANARRAALIADVAGAVAKQGTPSGASGVAEILNAISQVPEATLAAFGLKRA